MTAQMHQVDRTQIAGHRDQRQASGSLRQNHRAAHVHAVEHNPDVGRAVVHRTTGGPRSSPGASSRADGTRPELPRLRLVGNSSIAKAQMWTLTPSSLLIACRVASIRIGNQSGSNSKHGSVEGKA